MTSIGVDPGAMSLAAFCAATDLCVAVEQTGFYQNEEVADWVHHWIVIWRKDHGEFGYPMHKPLSSDGPMECLRRLVDALRDYECDDFEHFCEMRPSASKATCRAGFKRVGEHSQRLYALLGDWYDVLINEVQL